MTEYVVADYEKALSRLNTPLPSIAEYHELYAAAQVMFRHIQHLELTKLQWDFRHMTYCKDCLHKVLKGSEGTDAAIRKMNEDRTA